MTFSLVAFSLHRLPLKKIPGILLYLQHPRHYTQKKPGSHVKLQFLTLLNLKPTFAKYFDCATRKITANVRERNRREAEHFFLLSFFFIFCLIPILYFLWLTWRARFSKRRRNSLRLTFVLSGEARINIRGLGGWLPAEPGQSFTALVYNVDWQQDPKLQTPKVHFFLLFFLLVFVKFVIHSFLCGSKITFISSRFNLWCCLLKTRNIDVWIWFWKAAIPDKLPEEIASVLPLNVVVSFSLRLP